MNVTLLRAPVWELDKSWFGGFSFRSQFASFKGGDANRTAIHSICRKLNQFGTARNGALLVEKQRVYGSGLNMANSDKVVDCYAHPSDLGGLRRNDQNIVLSSSKGLLNSTMIQAKVAPILNR